MKRSLFPILLGLLVGSAFNVALHAQASDKVTVTGGFNVCVDTQQANVALKVAFDGGASTDAAGVTWQGLTARIPLSQFPAAAKTLGPHTVIVTTPDQTVTMADGSTQVIPGGPSAPIPYTVISTSAQPPSNPRWIKIAGTIALLLGLFAWLG